MNNNHDENDYSMKDALATIRGAQKIRIVGMELVVLPEKQFDELVHFVGTVFAEVRQASNTIAREKPETESPSISTSIINENPNALLTQKQVAAEWGISTQALEKWRFEGNGPEFIKFGKGRCGRIRYHRKAIIEFLKTATWQNTSQHRHKK